MYIALSRYTSIFLLTTMHPEFLQCERTVEQLSPSLGAGNGGDINNLNKERSRKCYEDNPS